MSPKSVPNVFKVVSTHEHQVQISQRVLAVALAAASQQRAEYLTGEIVVESTSQFPALDPGAAETELGSVLDILDRGARTHSEWLLLSCALGRAIAEEFDAADTDKFKLLGWLAANTPCNAWLYLERWYPEPDRTARGSAVMDAWGEMSQAEQSAVALAASSASSEPAALAIRHFAEQTADPTLSAVLASRLPAQRLEGELGRARSAGWVTVIAALSGILLIRSAWQLIARYILGSRRPARLTIGANGVEIEHKYLMLGRTLRNAKRVFPLEQIVSLERETRYHGVGLYAGILALTFGTYWGVSLLVDGARVPGGSASLLGLGAAIVTLGIALDFLLTRLSEIRTGGARLSLRTRKGSGFVLRDLDADAAEAALVRAQALRA